MPLNYSTGVVPSRWCLPKVVAQFEEYGRCLALADTITEDTRIRDSGIAKLGQKILPVHPPFTKISIVPIGRTPSGGWDALERTSLGIFLDYPQITPDP